MDDHLQYCFVERECTSGCGDGDTMASICSALVIITYVLFVHLDYYFFSIPKSINNAGNVRRTQC